MKESWPSSWPSPWLGVKYKTLLQDSICLVDAIAVRFFYECGLRVGRMSKVKICPVDS